MSQNSDPGWDAASPQYGNGALGAPHGPGGWPPPQPGPAAPQPRSYYDHPGLYGDGSPHPPASRSNGGPIAAIAVVVGVLVVGAIMFFALVAFIFMPVLVVGF